MPNNNQIGPRGGSESISWFAVAVIVAIFATAAATLTRSPDPEPYVTDAYLEHSIMGLLLVHGVLCPVNIC
jgi:hypothetical protein